MSFSPSHACCSTGIVPDLYASAHKCWVHVWSRSPSRTSKSETMVLSWKRIRCSIQVCKESKETSLKDLIQEINKSGGVKKKFLHRVGWVSMIEWRTGWSRRALEYVCCAIESRGTTWGYSSTVQGCSPVGSRQRSIRYCMSQWKPSSQCVPTTTIMPIKKCRRKTIVTLCTSSISLSGGLVVVRLASTYIFSSI